MLIFADALQGLVLSEAVARVDKIAAPAMGRPACAALPQALNAGNAVLSLGCCGARAYLDALDDRVAMWALPGIKSKATARKFQRLRAPIRFSRAFTSVVDKRSKRADCWAIARSAFILKQSCTSAADRFARGPESSAREEHADL
ncbi:MAG: hypothetical protein ACM3N3_15070 [Betaproteobacteria bacterium]